MIDKTNFFIFNKLKIFPRLMTKIDFFSQSYEKFKLLYVFFLFFPMTQKDLVIKWHNEGYTPSVIHEKLMDTFQELSISVSTVSRTIREASWTKNQHRVENFVGRPCNYNDDRKIRNELKKDSTLSCRKIAQIVKIPYSTVHYIMVHRLHLKCCRIKWIPHQLDSSQKNARLKYSKQLLDVLKSCSKNKWRYLVTGDESWFFYFTPNGTKWIDENETPSTTEKRGFGTKKYLLTIFWNPYGIAVIDVLPTCDTMDSSKFILHVLSPLTEFEPNIQAKKSRKRFWVHFDNAPCHRSKAVKAFMTQKKLSRAPHPIYSPDLSPCDFYLFGKIKRSTEGIHFKDENELLETIQDEFYKIPKEELFRVFNSWIDRCNRCIMCNGDYFE